MDLALQDRVALVAGASAGLGLATAVALAREGCRVAICSRSEERIRTAADEVRRAAGSSQESEEHVLPIAGDVTIEADVERVVQQTVDHFGGLHVLVTNAGGPPSGAADAFDAEAWRAALELNLMSTINLCTHALPHLRRAAQDDRHARIVMVTSISAKQPIPGLALSNTARAGVQGYAKSLAEALGPEGITVNTVLPGYTRTERLNDLAQAIVARTEQSREEVEAGWAADNALRRIGEPEEFAAAVAFLASGPARYITGVALPVDGGRSKHVL